MGIEGADQKREGLKKMAKLGAVFQAWPDEENTCYNDRTHLKQRSVEILKRIIFHPKQQVNAFLGIL